MWLTILGLAFAGPNDEDDTVIEFEADFVHPAPMMRMKATFGATPGGAQDIAYFRDQAEAGEIPLPEVFTPEGLFSEHDLPLPDAGCDRLLCTVTATSEARLLAQEDVRWLGQVGFSSMLTPETYTRPPLNVVAVVDQSCSMSDQPIETVKASLETMVGQFVDGDQLSIVVYGSGVTTHLAPTTDVAAMKKAIRSIQIDGSTNMEAGLLRGFELARQTRRSFDGVSRVMLFTDERPNVGNTDAEGFMAIAEAGSRDHVGMTTFGVGVQFGAELATKVSSVRGGNLFFFPDYATMKEKFAEDFDTFVMELAYDLEMTVRPAPGTRIAGIYGIPGDAVEWGDDGSLEVSVKTVFLSKEKGAIYVGFAPDGALPRKASAVGEVTLSYTARDGGGEPRTMAFATTKADVPVGLTRGELLVDEATTLKKVAMLHHRENDQVGAYHLVHALADRFRSAGDATLGKEVSMIEALERTLAQRAGFAGESGGSRERDDVSGLPISRRAR